MKLVSIIFLSTILSNNLFAQWFWQNPLPQGNTLTSVSYIDQNTGWAVGLKGTILKTTNQNTDYILPIAVKWFYYNKSL